MKHSLATKSIFILLIALLRFPPALSAQEERTPHRVSFSATLTSSDSYSTEIAYHYMFCNCAGVGGAVGYWANWYEDGWASGRNWNIADDDNKPSNLYLRPSVVLKTPGLKIRAASWSLFAEPGIMLNVPYQRVCIESTPNWPTTDYDYVSTGKGQWFAMDLRVGIALEMGPCGLSAGYMMSNLDIYSQYRHLSYKGVSFEKFYPEKPFMQGAYISLSYNF